MPRKREVPEERIEHKNLGVFRQHGFVPGDESGDNQVFGNCIFCASENKFFVNIKTKFWDCKVCGLEGGYKTFLRELYQNGVDYISRKQLKILSDNRGIKIDTLKAHDVGYNSATDSYIFPVWDLENKDIVDTKIYNLNIKTLYSSLGSTVNLYGGDVLNLSNKNEIDIVWLVEGHWDKMVMWEILKSLDRKKEVVVAVPGAYSFKDYWTPLFTDKHVKVVYDNDYNLTRNKKIIPGAGKGGMIKVYDFLYSTAHKLEFIHWLNCYSDGFDIRDLYNKKANSSQRTFKILECNLVNEPPDYEKFSKKRLNIDTKKFEGAGCDIQEVYDIFNKYLKLENNYIIDITYATIISNRLDGDPVWIYLVGPSGCGKSEVIMSLDDYKFTEATSSLTAASLISGKRNENGVDTSLIPMLDGKIFTIKDFTTILNLNQTTFIEIVGILRDAYDGQCAKHFGMGFKKEYKSKFGIIAGVTHAIELYNQGLTALGERFLKFIIPVDLSLQGERLVCQQVMKNVLQGNKSTMKTELKTIGAKFLDCEFKKIPELSTALQNKIISLAQWCGMMRGTITRDFRKERIIHLPMKEYVTRLTSNFTLLLLGLGMIHRDNEINGSHYEVIKHVARGTPPQNNSVLLTAMLKAGKSMQFTGGDMSDMIGLPIETTKMIAEDLTMLRVLKRVDRKVDNYGKKYRWKLSNDILKLIEETDII